MPGTELVTVKMNRGVSYVDPKKMNREAAKRQLARAASPKSPFAGMQIRPNGQDGVFQLGYGNGAKTKESIKMVINVPQALTVWQYWPEEEAPTYPYIASIFSGDVLPDRADCGPKETKYNRMKKADEDVWKEGTVLILRDPKTNELAHLECFNNVNKKASEFLLSVADAAELDKGLLPLVELSFGKIKLKDGGSFYAVSFDTVEWVKSTKADMPAGLESAKSAEADEDDDDDDDRPAKSARSRDADDHDPRKGNGGSRDPRNRPRTIEDDEADDDEKPAAKRKARAVDEDEDDEKPVVRSRRARADDDDEKPAAKRKARAVDDEDDEDDAKPVRRRRLN